MTIVTETNSTNRDHATLWVCIDCHFAEANGELPEEPDREPWGAIHPDDLGRIITPGLMSEEHADNCDVFRPNDYGDRDYHGEHECFCGDQDFSWSPCDGCGSHLGGSRHAYTMDLDDEREGPRG